MSAGKGRTAHIGRQPINFRLEHTTIARLARLAGESGLSQGVIIDRAVGALETCAQCDGEGHEAGDPSVRCGRCKGTRLEQA